MAGIQISGLLTNQAFDWKSVVDQLIAADSVPITNLQNQKSTNTDKITALGDVNTALQNLQDALQSIRAGNVFAGRTVSSDDANTTWKSSSAANAPVGTYVFAVSQLATASTLAGKTDIGSGLAASDDVSGLTIASLNTASAVKDGYFTVNGARVNVASTDSLQDVFDAISAATGNTVTASYDHTTDTVTLASSSGQLLLGAANDTSNFLQVMKLSNSGTAASTSTSTLGTIKKTATLLNADLATTPVGDGNGDGSFTINNVTIAYNVNNDSLSSIISRINQSGAGVTASYDANGDRFTLTNGSTGDVGMTISEAPGSNLLTALGLMGTDGTFTRGNNAQFTVNGGATITSASNTLDASVHGITGLSVTVNSATTQTVTVDSDVGSMQDSIQKFLDTFNAVQDTIDDKTKITLAGGSVTTSILSDNREIQSWQRQLQSMAFDTVTGITGSVTHLDDLGIDFDGTTGHLIIKDQSKLASALTDHPEDVQSFFVSGSNGMVPQMYGLLTTLMSSGRTQQDDISQASLDIDNQISTLQSRLDDERTQLTNSFIAMLDAQSAAQSQNQALTNAFFKNNSNS